MLSYFSLERMSKAIRLANLSQKAVKSLLLKSQSAVKLSTASSSFSLNLVVPTSAVVQKRAKSYYGEPKLFKESTEILLSVDEDADIKWKQMPPNRIMKFPLS